MKLCETVLAVHHSPTATRGIDGYEISAAVWTTGMITKGTSGVEATDVRSVTAAEGRGDCLMATRYCVSAAFNCLTTSALPPFGYSLIIPESVQ